MSLSKPHRNGPPLFNELTRQFLIPAADYFEKDVDVIGDRLFDGEFGGMALSFLMQEMAVTTWGNERQTPIDMFLKQRGWREKPHGRRFIRALNEADLAFLEVCQVEPGESIEVRPQGTNKRPVRIVEHSASESLYRYDTIVARIITLGNTRRFGAILPLTPDSSKYLRDELDGIPDELAGLYQELVQAGEAAEATENLVDEIPTVRFQRLTEYSFTCWVINVLDPPSQRPPQLRNTDDERIVMTNYRFPVKGDLSEIARHLNAAPDLIDEPDQLWVWLKSDGSRTVQGQCRLAPDQLLFETNSVERAERGIAFLQSLLGQDLIGQPLRVHQCMEDLMATKSAEPAATSSPGLHESPEVQALLQATLQDHYRKTLDEAIAMLGNESPRTCAADPAKHEKVVGWLKYLENSTEKSSGPNQSFDWMWDELGFVQVSITVLSTGPLAGHHLPNMLALLHSEIGNRQIGYPYDNDEKTKARTTLDEPLERDVRYVAASSCARVLGNCPGRKSGRNLHASSDSA